MVVRGVSQGGAYGFADVLINLAILLVMVPPAVLLIRNRRSGRIWATVIAVVFIAASFVQALTNTDDTGNLVMAVLCLLGFGFVIWAVNSKSARAVGVAAGRR